MNIEAPTRVDESPNGVVTVPTGADLESQLKLSIEFLTVHPSELLKILLETHPQLLGLFHSESLEKFASGEDSITKVTLREWILHRHAGSGESRVRSYIDSWIEVNSRRVKLQFGVDLDKTKKFAQERKIRSFSVVDCIYLFYCFHDYLDKFGAQYHSQYYFNGEPEPPSLKPPAIPIEFCPEPRELAAIVTDNPAHVLDAYMMQIKANEHLSQADDLMLRRQVVAAVQLAKIEPAVYSPQEKLVLRQGRLAADRLVRSVLHMAVGMALKFRDDDIWLEDLIQVANLAITEAVFRVNDVPGNKFTTIAHYEILGALQQFTIAQNKARNMRREPGGRSTSLDEGYGGQALHERIADPQPTVEKRVQKGLELLRLKDALKTANLTDKHNYVITRYFGLDGAEPMTLEEVGQTMPGRPIGREAVRQLLNTALNRLKRNMIAQSKPKSGARQNDSLST